MWFFAADQLRMKTSRTMLGGAAAGAWQVFSEAEALRANRGKIIAARGSVRFAG